MRVPCLHGHMRDYAYAFNICAFLGESRSARTRMGGDRDNAGTGLRGAAYVFSTHVRVPEEFEPYMRDPAEEARKQIRAERVAEQSRMIGTMLSATGTKRNTTESASSKL